MSIAYLVACTLPGLPPVPVLDFGPIALAGRIPGGYQLTVMMESARGHNDTFTLKIGPAGDWDDVRDGVRAGFHTEKWNTRVAGQTLRVEAPEGATVTRLDRSVTRHPVVSPCRRSEEVIPIGSRRSRRGTAASPAHLV